MFRGGPLSQHELYPKKKNKKTHQKAQQQQKTKHVVCTHEWKHKSKNWEGCCKWVIS